MLVVIAESYLAVPWYSFVWVESHELDDLSEGAVKHASG